MFNNKPEKKFTVPAALSGLIETTRPLADGTLRRLERKLETVRAVHAIRADGDYASRGDDRRAHEFAAMLALGAELVRQRGVRAALTRMGAYVSAGVDPARVFRELCIGAAGALHRHHVDDLRGFLSVIHAAGVVWPACDTPRPADVADALAFLGVEPSSDAHTTARALMTTPAPAFLAVADKLRASGVRGGAFAAFAAEGLGELVATGEMTQREAAEVWAEEVWRPGELATLVAYSMVLP